MTFKFLPKLDPLPEDARRTPVMPEPSADAPAQIRVEEIPDPWERQRGEGEEAWAKFLAFRDAPLPRRIIRPGAGRTQDLYRMANEWRWFERVEAYDNHLQRIRQKEIDAFVKQNAKEVAAEHMAVLRDAREFAAIEISRMLERARRNAIDGALKPAEVFRLYELALKYDRVYRDQANDIVEDRGAEATAANLSLEETRDALELIEKMHKVRVAT